MGERPDSTSAEALLANAAWVRALAQRLVQDESLADDLVQDTWVAALEHPPRIASAGRTWLRTVVRNFALLARRTEANRARREGAAARPETLPSTAEMVERAALQHLVVEEVLALSEPARSTVLLHFFEGVSSEEIARRLAVPSSTVRGRLMRALAELRSRLDRRLGGDRNAWFGTLAPLVVGARVGETAVSSTVKGMIVASGIAKTTAAIALGVALAIGLIGGLYVAVGRERAEPAASPAPGLVARSAAPEATPPAAIETLPSQSAPPTAEKPTTAGVPQTPASEPARFEDSASQSETPPSVERNEPRSGESIAASRRRYEVAHDPKSGEISGIVKFIGKAEVIKLKTTKDLGTCHDEKDSPRLKVSESGGVASAVVYLEGITQGKGIDDMPSGSLDQKKCEYLPHVQVVPWNKEFLIKSSDPILHNVHMNYKDGDATIANIPFPEPGQSKKKFKRPGLAYVKCDAGHIWMSAYVFATDNPYVVVSDADGNFSIKDVPAGKYKLVMWHEGYLLKETQKDSSGTPTAFIWSDDVVLKRDVVVEADNVTTIDFEIGR